MAACNDCEKEKLGCEYCGKPTLTRCSGCHIVLYCDNKIKGEKGCNLLDWPRHKFECKKPHILADLKRLSTPSVGIRHTGSPVMNIGAYAKQSLTKGSMVYEENFLFACVDRIVSDDTMLKFISPDEDKLKRLLRLFHDATLETLAERLYSVMKYNAFAESNGLLVLFEGLARFNHSCSPNLFLQIDETEQHYTAKLIAIRDISVGEDLTISYITNNYTETSQRQKSFQKKSGCPCACSTCATSTQKIDLTRSLFSTMLAALIATTVVPDFYQTPKQVLDGCVQMMQMYLKCLPVEETLSDYDPIHILVYSGHVKLALKLAKSQPEKKEEYLHLARVLLTSIERFSFGMKNAFTRTIDEIFIEIEMIKELE